MALEWSWWKDWWRLKKRRHRNNRSRTPDVEDSGEIEDLEDCCFCDDCYGELSDGCSNEDGCMGGSDLEGEGKQVLVGVCAMAKKSQSKPMKEILTRLEEFEYIKIVVFPEEVILKEPVEGWPIVDCLISFHSKGFPLDKAIHYANLRNPFIINNLPMQYDIQDRRRVYAILDSEGIEIPRYAVLDRDSADPKHHELVESEDHVEVNGVTFNKPFVEKPVSAEDHNIYIYYPTSAGGGSQRLFRKIGSRSSVYSPESRVRKTGSYIYEDFMPTDGTDVKVYTVGPDYAHAEARKSPALDGKVERDSEGKEIRYPVILSNAEKLISRKVCLAFKQTVCGFDLLRANGKSFVCDVNGFSFVKNSNKYYDDCAKILGNMILRELAPTLHIPWSVPFQLDDPPIVPTTFGKMMELRCVVAVIRHGDRTPKQKMKVEVRHPKFFEIFAKYDGYKHGHVKLKRPKQLQEILDTARSLLTEIQHRAAGPELEEKQGKLEQLKSVLEMYGHFSGINRKVQMKYQPRGRPRGSSSDDGNSHNRLGEPSLVLILKWGGELTPAGRIQAEELGRIFRCMYPGGQGRHLSDEDSEMLPSHGEYAGAQGLGLLRLHSTFRHDLKIYASDEGRVQMTAAAFAKGLLALEGELTPILVQMVKSANTNGLLDNDCDSSKYQNLVKTRLHELLQQDREFTPEDREQINPGNAISINDALDFVKNPVRCCQHVQALIQKLMDIVRIKKDDPKTKDTILYHGETWELMGRRWGKIEKDFCTKNKRFDISKIPDIYDCIKYDLQHNNHTLQFDDAEELYIYAKYLADIVIPQEYGLTVQEKLTIGQGICTPLLKKIRADLQRNIEESGEETVNRLNPRYSHGVSSPGRHVRTRLYFTSESHVHSLLTVLRYGGLLDVVKDEQWRRAMEYVSMVSELNYMSQIVVMLYEDPTKDPSSEERFHVELHFSPGVNCCVQKNLPPGPGFRPHSRNESSHNLETNSQCSTRIDEEDAELGGLDDGNTNSPPQSRTSKETSPVLAETDETPDTTLDSPTTSRTIDMMDLDPNMMDEPYDSGFLQASAPIPISARTVAGHEAARLGSQLAASQRQRREREAGGICEPRARSYDHQRQDKPEKTVEKLQYQSLDAVNKEDEKISRRCDLDTLFYEKVESLIIPKNSSTRSSNSLNIFASTAITSLPSSSSNLANKLVDHHHLEDEKPKEEFSKETTKISVASCENFVHFWDFGDEISMRIPEERSDEELKNLKQAGKSELDNIPENSPKKRSADKSGEISESKYFEGNSFPRRTSSREEKMLKSRLLGITISLPHSLSSPDLPAPVKETILEASEPVVTLHKDSIDSRGDRARKPPSCASCNLLPIQAKRYFRSKSALTLPTGYDGKGESGLTETIFDISQTNLSESSHHRHCRESEKSNDHENVPKSEMIFLDLAEEETKISSGFLPKFSISLPARLQSYKRRNSLDVPGFELKSTQSSRQNIPFRRASSFLPQKQIPRSTFITERSRSLSPSPQRCLCYNCNVSTFIRQSVNLPPQERSNFETYFVRSLSHKFINCRCYKISRTSRSVSPNSTLVSESLLSSRRLSRKLSCPILSEGRICENFLPNCREICSCPMTEKLSVASNRFLTPDSVVDKKFARWLPRKFSCPEIIVETPISRECENLPELRENIESKKFHETQEEREDEEEDEEHPQKSGNSGSKKFVSRQASCPEIIDYFPAEPCTLMHYYEHADTSEISSNSSQSEIPSNSQDENISTCLNDSSIDRLCLTKVKIHRNEHAKFFSTLTDFSDTDTFSTYSKRARNMPHSLSSSLTSLPMSKSSSSSSHPRLQTQRSFSSPDTRPSIIQQPDPTCTARRHRHSISGQMSYFKLLGYNVSKKLTGSTNSLFSTAVISGSSSAPNLKDMVPPHASAVAAIEGFGGVPPIRPLETLHNALSLRQLDSFLDMMTNASLFRTPASSPPKFPSPGGSIHSGSVVPNLSIVNINREYNASDLESVRYITPAPMHYKPGLDSEGNDNRNQLSPTSPNSAGWSSGPQSFLSSGPSSPAPTSAGESSMSMSLVSNDGSQPFTSSKVSTTPCLDIDFNDFCRTIDQEIHGESRGSISYTDYYSNEDGLIRKTHSDLANLRERVAQGEMAHDSAIDDEEDHTLTLREAEEHRKQDVKFIFDQSKDTSGAKASSSYKKIGRFRVESMEIADEDVRIKESTAGDNMETSGSNVSLDRAKVKSDSQESMKSKASSGTPQNRSRQRVNTISRSQSVSTPQSSSRKPDVDFSCQTSKTKTGSFSTMSCEDLENWKLTAASSSISVTSPGEVVKEEPMLTVAGSLKGSPNVVIGFNVPEHKKD